MFDILFRHKYVILLQCFIPDFLLWHYYRRLKGNRTLIQFLYGKDNTFGFVLTCDMSFFEYLFVTERLLLYNKSSLTNIRGKFPFISVRRVNGSEKEHVKITW